MNRLINKVNDTEEINGIFTCLTTKRNGKTLNRLGKKGKKGGWALVAGPMKINVSLDRFIREAAKKGPLRKNNFFGTFFPMFQNFNAH